MGKEMILKNEFAQVSVEIDYFPAGTRLKIKDVRTKREIYLDPLELESLAWCDHKDLHPFFRPFSNALESKSATVQSGDRFCLILN